MSSYRLKNMRNYHHIMHDGKVKCKNKICDYECYYSLLSFDGFCYECDFKMFPGKYAVCLICKKLNKTSICFTCRDEIKKLLFDVFKKCDKSVIELGINQILKKYELMNSEQSKIFINEKCKLLNIDPWKGFYKGNFEWIVPDISKWNIDIDDITNENCEMIILRELEKNGIFIYKDEQVK